MDTEGAPILRRAVLLLALALAAIPMVAEPISPATWRAVMAEAARQGVPLSIANRMQIEESGDPRTGGWGNALAIGRVSKEGYRALGLYQIYDKPSNMAWLVRKYWTPYHLATPFDVFNPLHNTALAMRYLAALHRRLGTWYAALCYYQCGRVEGASERTRGYARRIVEARAPTLPDARKEAR